MQEYPSARLSWLARCEGGSIPVQGLAGWPGATVLLSVDLILLTGGCCGG